MNDNTPETRHEGPEFCDYRPDDNRYAGAHEMIRAELDYIRRRRGEAPSGAQEEPPADLAGLALSGGGIRSATFCLGVMQALARHGRLKDIDYLSTVSGGGYIGSSLTWLTHQQGFGVGPDDFPFGTERPYKHDEQRKVLGGADRNKRRVLRWLRQHGEYLTPGAGITLASFIAVILRCILLSVLVYFPLLVLSMLVLTAVGVFAPSSGQWPSWIPGPTVSLAGAAVLAGVLVVYMIFYSVGSFFSRTQVPERGQPSTAYALRRGAEKWAGRGLILLVVLLVLWSLPVVSAWLDEWSLDLGLLSSVLGAGFASELFRRSEGGKGGAKLLPSSIIAGLGFVLLVYGVLLLSFETASSLYPESVGAGGPQWDGIRIGLVVAMTLLVVLVGRFTNLNYVSIHRYYRDRLMEAFMPNIPFQDPPEPAATKADVAALHTMAPTDGPYHIVNTNVVLVGSRVAKFRGRGGDNFILSPGYCGGNATGWRRTDKFMDGHMMLPTAMAISGAAANPHTGVGGEGITRGFFASFLLAFLNIRLGYWAPNPNPERVSKAVQGRKPNFLYPGLWELLFLKRLSEHSPMLELTDGGHFENLALYELVRRKCSLIICCDGAADPDFAFGDLANAMEKVRVDFGAKIKVTSQALESLASGMKHAEDGAKITYAERGFIEADIEYADDPPDREPKAKLLYIKATFPKGLPADLHGYKLANPDFPNQSTADQFFDEKQFEAYRELGFHLGDAAVRGGTWRSK